HRVQDGSVGAREALPDRFAKYVFVLAMDGPIDPVGCDDLCAVMVLADLETGDSELREAVKTALGQSEVEPRKARGLEAFRRGHGRPHQHLAFRNGERSELSEER